MFVDSLDHVQGCELCVMTHGICQCATYICVLLLVCAACKVCDADGQLIVDQQEVPVEIFAGLLQGGAHAGDR